MANYWQDVKAIARGVWEMFQDPEHPFDESSSESREGETWMAVSNSKWITGKKKWQDVLGLSKNVPGLEDFGIDPHRKRVYWMPPYPEYDHWWDFVPGEDPELTVKRLGAAAAMKRDVDDEIEKYDKIRRKRWGVADLKDAETDAALEEAKEAGIYGILERIGDYYGIPAPETAEEILGWLVYARDEDMRAMESGWSEYERAEAEGRLLLIGKFIRKLKMLEVVASSPPWVRERKKWGLMGFWDSAQRDSWMEAIDAAEAKTELASTISDNALNMREPEPETPEEWLAWIEYQAGLERRAAEEFERQDRTGFAAEAQAYAEVAESTARRLRALGYKPAPMPWDRERLRWRPK